MGTVIGIDLGTTNSCVAFMSAGQSEVIANSEGARTTPSMVAFTDSGEKLVGQIAKRQAVTNPECTVFAVKRLIGRKMDSEEVRGFSAAAPFKVVGAENGDAWVQIKDRDCSPQEIAAMVLSKMKDTAADFLGEPVEEVVITVPAYFNDAQRQATKEAGTVAGLTVLRIINEPTAAALAYGIGEEDDKTVAVFDLGGGTFDISILEIGDGVFQVMSTNGDTYLGGEDFDHAIVEHLAEVFETEHRIDLRQDPMALQRSRKGPSAPSRSSRPVEETDINLPFIGSDDTGPKHLVMTFRAARSSKSWSVTCSSASRRRARTAIEDAGLSVRWHRRGDPGRRHDAHADGAAQGRRDLRPRAEHQRQPDEVVAVGRRSRAACSRATSRTCCCST